MLTPRVTFWMGGWHPTREAVSKEVALLHADHPRGWIVSSVPGQWPAASLAGRRIRIPASSPTVAAVWMAAAERLGDVSHVFNALNAWIYLRVLGHRPFVFTATWAGQPSARERELYGKVSLFAAETEVLAASLRDAGVGPERIRVVYPGVDLDRFRPIPRNGAGRFRLLFASTPADPSECEARGILLMADVARMRPDVDFVLLWRAWGSRAEAESVLASLDLPANVIVQWGDVADMAAEYQRADATICAFADGFGKSCPNSVIEGLACGRPAILTDTIGLAPLVARTGAGVVATRQAAPLAEAIDVLRRDYETHSRCARAVAESCFDERRFRETYAGIYRDVLARRASRRPVPAPNRGPGAQAAEVVR